MLVIEEGISTQLCELLPLSPSLCFNSPPFLVWTSILCTRIQCVLGGVWRYGLQTDKICRKVPLQGIFFRWRHFALPSISPNLATVVCRQGPRGGVHGAEVWHKAGDAGQPQLCPGGESNPGSLLSDPPPCRLPGSRHGVSGPAL